MTSWDDPAAARTMWTLFEPLHAVTYFSPEPRAAYEQAGLRGFWRGYFAGRAAPLGPVGPAPVVACFFGFAPPTVARALPDVWTRAEPQAALHARLAGARAAMSRLFGALGIDADVDGDVAEAAALLRRAAESVRVAGRPLAAANAHLPWPQDPLGTLWHAATVLREHRGDGHVAALTVAGLDGCECMVWRAAVDSDRQVLQPARGWSDQEWDAARRRLAGRGWLDEQGRATGAALAARDRIEASTDELAAGPWQELGAGRTARLAALLTPLTKAASTQLPFPNPIGLAPPAEA
jgi:hypothetical protein